MLSRIARNAAATFAHQRQAISSSPALRGLEEFFEAPLKEGQERTAGKAWSAADLRKKSWDDLHKLWYILLKERNLLQSEKLRLKVSREPLPNPNRMTKVRKSMARIKAVLSERAHAEESGQRKNELLRFIDAL